MVTYTIAKQLSGVRPFEAMLDLFRTAKLRRFYDPIALVSAVPVSVVILVGAVLSLQSHSVLRQDRDLVIHTYEVIGTSTQVLLSAGDAETGQRGFIITGDPTFLEPYWRASRITIPKELHSLQTLVGDNPSQLRRVAHLKLLLERKFDELSQTLKVYQEKGFASAGELHPGYLLLRSAQ